nr:hypothetical protein CFP56_20529 [Quercus suber]
MASGCFCAFQGCDVQVEQLGRTTRARKWSMYVGIQLTAVGGDGLVVGDESSGAGNVRCGGRHQHRLHLCEV